MAVHTIESRDVRVEVDPLFGARVLSLIDKRSGRDWIAKGPQSKQVGEEAIYLADEAVGWDECFPTVAPWDASGTSWGRPLRDHGELWGRPWAIDAQSGDSLTLSYSDRAFRFTRHLSIRDAALTAQYAVENLAAAPLSFMWALHGLLAVTPEDRTSLAGIDSVAASYLSLNGRTIEAQRLAWPGPDKALGIALDTVQPVSAHVAAKLYASHIAAARASVGGRNGWLDIGWDNRELGHLGLWLNYGGWPSPGNVYHLALEPTTAPVDHLGQALEQGSAVILAPASTSSWSVTLTLRHPSTSSH